MESHEDIISTEREILARLDNESRKLFHLIKLKFLSIDCHDHFKGTQLFQSLLSNSSLETLELSEVEPSLWPQIGQFLSTNKTLKTLDLSYHTKLSLEGCRSLCEGLKANKTLKKLQIDLEDDQMILNFFEALKSFKSLEKLDIRVKKASEIGFTAIWESIKVNVSLKVFRVSFLDSLVNNFPFNSLYEALITNDTLEKLELDTDMNVTIKKIDWMSLNEGLKNNRSITSLTINWHIDTQDEGSMYLSEAIKVRQDLKEFKLRQHIDPDSLKKISEALAVSSITSIYLHVTNQTESDSTNSLLTVLKHSKSIKKALLTFGWSEDIPFNEVSPYLESFLTTNSTLTLLSMFMYINSPIARKALCNGLAANKTLTDLDLYNCPLSNEGALLLSQALRVNNTIKILNIADCNIEQDGYIALFDALKFNSGLTDLNLGDYDDRENCLGETTFDALCHALKINRTLTAIRGVTPSYALRENPKILDKIADVLRVSDTLRLLSFGTYIDVENFDPLYQALKENQTLTELSMRLPWDKPLPDIKPIEELFIVNYSLRSLFNQAMKRTLQPYFERNIEFQSEVTENTIILIHNIARSEDARIILPMEMWLLIFGFIKYPGVHLDFGRILRQVIGQRKKN